MSHRHTEIPPTRSVLFSSVESANHEYLARNSGIPVVASPRELAALDAPHIAVVPASTSRDLAATVQAAQTLQWMKRHNPSRTLLLAEPISGDTYAIAQMRHHIRKLSEDADALIFVSATVDPFADAELFRRVRLAQQYSEKIEVGVAFDEVAPVSNPAWPTVKAVQQRLERLNCVSIRRVRADLYHDPKGQDIDLFKPTALRAAVTTAVEKARHRAEHGDDGISAGLMADHGAGFAHSHGSGDGEGHSHGHGHNQAHAHFHSHTDR